MLKRALLIAVILLLCFSPRLPGQDIGTEENIKAVLIYNFTKFLHWPDDVLGDRFKVGVIGNHDIAAALKVISAKKSIKNLPALIEETSSLNGITKYNLIYLSGESGINVSSIVNAVKDKPILVIGDNEGWCEKGVSINLIKRDGKIKFEINLSVLKETGIESNSRFIKLADQLYE